MRLIKWCEYRYIVTWASVWGRGLEPLVEGLVALSRLPLRGWRRANSNTFRVVLFCCCWKSWPLVSVSLCKRSLYDSDEDCQRTGIFTNRCCLSVIPSVSLSFRSACLCAGSLQKWSADIIRTWCYEIGRTGWLPVVIRSGIRTVGHRINFPLPSLLRNRRFQIN